MQINLNLTINFFLVPELVEGKDILFIPAPPSSQGEEAAQREVCLCTLRQAQGPGTLTIHHSLFFIYRINNHTIRFDLKAGLRGFDRLEWFRNSIELCVQRIDQQ